jgi:hypothetical protein
MMAALPLGNLPKPKSRIFWMSFILSISTLTLCLRKDGKSNSTLDAKIAIQGLIEAYLKLEMGLPSEDHAAEKESMKTTTKTVSLQFLQFGEAQKFIKRCAANLTGRSPEDAVDGSQSRSDMSFIYRLYLARHSVSRMTERCRQRKKRFELLVELHSSIGLKKGMERREREI